MDDLPAGPWSYWMTQSDPLANGHVYIIDASGRKIVNVWGKPAEKVAIAELIINARDAVKPL
jgi:hypothetical protein